MQLRQFSCFERFICKRLKTAHSRKRFLSIAVVLWLVSRGRALKNIGPKFWPWTRCSGYCVKARTVEEKEGYPIVSRDGGCWARAAKAFAQLSIIQRTLESVVLSCIEVCVGEVPLIVIAVYSNSNDDGCLGPKLVKRDGERAGVLNSRRLCRIAKAVQSVGTSLKSV